jgi:ABC-type multidrug transport system fused ATPase/permease subunit
VSCRGSLTLMNPMKAASKLRLSFFRTISSSQLKGRASAKVPDKITAQRLLLLAAPHKSSIAGAIALLSVSSAVTMAVPYSMGAIIDAVSGQDGTSLNNIFLTLGCVFGVGAAANTGRIILFKRVGERIIASLRKDLFRNIIHQDLKFHDLNSSGEIVSRLAVDTVVVGKSVTSNVSDGLRSIIMAGAGVGAMAAVNSKLTVSYISLI